LLGGAGPEGVTYDLAVQLLGYTPDSLLDESIDAFAAHDGSTVFRVIDKVIESGQDPRRFAEDLLQRLRDLVIVKAVPDALSTGLLDAPPDRAERLQQQASLFGGSELTRAADIVNEALVDFRGATAPRLLLELMSARILVPTADQSDHGLAARLDRLERRIGIEGGAPEAVPPAPAPAPTVTSSPTEPESSVPDDGPEAPEAPEPVAEAPASEAEPAPLAGALGIADVRRLWPGVLDRVREIRRLPWVVLSQNAQLLALDGDTLTIGLVNAGARDSFVSTGSVDVLRQALQDVLGVAWDVDAIVDPTASPSADASSAPEDGSSPRRGASAPEGVRRAAKEGPPATLDNPDAAAHPDDPVIDSDLDPEQLLAAELGAKVIDEST
jgi:DNA polymerase-3 subunit gamma/tau